jgi:hypothetical protein
MRYDAAKAFSCPADDMTNDPLEILIFVAGAAAVVAIALML